MRKEQSELNGENSHEKKERPRYRFIFHGSFRQFLPNILEKGFKYSEYYPFLTISPSYAFNFTKNEIKRGLENLRNRARHLDEKDRDDLQPEDMKSEDALLLVIEPPENFEVHATNQGRPNVFTSFDEIPRDIDTAVYSRSFVDPQYELRSRPFVPVGMHHQAKRVINEAGVAKWIDRDLSEKKEVKQGYINPEMIKLSIPRNEAFDSIFSDLRKELENSEIINDETLKKFKDNLFEYLSSGHFEVHNSMSDADLRQIADNMIDGEFEHLVVEQIRSLFLLVEKYKGKKIVKISQRKETEKFTNENQEEIRNRVSKIIRKIKTISVSNSVLMRYISIYSKKFEEEMS